MVPEYDDATGYPVEVCPGVWHTRLRGNRFMNFLRDALTFAKTMWYLGPVLLALLVGCASAGSGMRTAPLDARRGKAEIRIENHNWALARVYVSTFGGAPRRIATVNTGSTDTVYVRLPESITFSVRFLAGPAPWVGTTRWSTQQCLHLTIENVLYLTFVVPCWR